MSSNGQVHIHFTQIELLVVVIIIGVLAAIAIPTFLAQRENARQGAQESGMRNLASTAITCSADNDGSYAGCNVAALQATPYNFIGTDDVTCTDGTISATEWGASCRRTLLPAGQSASFSTVGGDAGQVTRNGY